MKLITLPPIEVCPRDFIHQLVHDQGLDVLLPILSAMQSHLHEEMDTGEYYGDEADYLCEVLNKLSTTIKTYKAFLNVDE